MSVKTLQNSAISITECFAPLSLQAVLDPVFLTIVCSTDENSIFTGWTNFFLYGRAINMQDIKTVGKDNFPFLNSTQETQVVVEPAILRVNKYLTCRC